MAGRPSPARGRPPKTGSQSFKLLALAAYSRHLSQEAITARINRVLGTGFVSQPTVGKWLRRELARCARPTIAVKNPDALDLRVVCLLFRRSPAHAIALARLLAREPFVARVERWNGDFNVFAEVMALDQRTIDDIIECFEPDAAYVLVERRDRVRAVLQQLAAETVR